MTGSCPRCGLTVACHAVSWRTPLPASGRGVAAALANCHLTRAAVEALIVLESRDVVLGGVYA